MKEKKMKKNNEEILVDPQKFLKKLISKPRLLLKIFCRIEGFLYGILFVPVYFLFVQNAYPLLNAGIIIFINIYLFIPPLLINLIDEQKNI